VSITSLSRAEALVVAVTTRVLVLAAVVAPVDSLLELH
jgi:hypothetical protein